MTDHVFPPSTRADHRAFRAAGPDDFFTNDIQAAEARRGGNVDFLPLRVHGGDEKQGDEKWFHDLRFVICDL